MSKSLYYVCIAMGLIGYFTIPAFICVIVGNDKEKYTNLYNYLFRDNKPFNLKSYIGIGNYILIGLLVAFTPLINFISTILLLLCISDRLLEGMLKLLEYYLDEGE